MMKRELILLFLIGILLFLPLISAQEKAQTYSSFDRFIDNVKMFFTSGDDKVMLALEIREKELNSAITNTENGNNEKAEKNLERARERLQYVQKEVSNNTAEDVKANAEKMIEKINQEENASDDFNLNLLEEQKTQLTAELTQKTYEYCKELAKKGYQEMLKEEICNPKTAQKGLEKELTDLKDLQERMFVKLMLEIRSCIDDPGTCNCENNLDAEEKAKCEKMVALALNCEYKDDESSCNELKSMEPKKGNGFAESFVPDFLMNLFKEKESKMIGYEIEPSCGVPEECWDKNDKPECKQYEHLKETSADWDEYGNYIGHERECDKQMLTMKESIPQCFDENSNFLEEKCGEITMIKNEKGLINYIIGKEVEKVIDKFENASMQNRIDVSGTEGKTILNEVKQEIGQINEQIAERVIKTDIAQGNNGGDGGLKPEIKTDVDSGGTKDEPLPEPDLNQINPDLYDPDARAPGDTIDETYDDNTVNSGSCGDGVDCGDGSAEPGTEGTNDIAPAVDSNQGD